MSAAAELLENPVTGERFRWHVTEAETHGKLTRAEVWVRSGGGVYAAHLHPHSEERFEVLKGRLVLEVDGDPRVLLGGECASVPAGVPHRWRNGGDDELHLFVEVHDPRGFERMIEAAFAAARAGRTDEHGVMDPLTGAEFIREHGESLLPATPPRWVLRILVPPLAALARLRARVSRRSAGEATSGERGSRIGVAVWGSPRCGGLPGERDWVHKQAEEAPMTYMNGEITQRERSHG